MWEIHTLLSPEELHRRMQGLIGNFDRPLQVLMGPRHVKSNGDGVVRLYVSTSNKNPNSDSCSNTERSGSIDVETGEGVVRFRGPCP